MAEEQDQGFSILDDGGTLHEFPGGFNPQQAARIVQRSWGDEQAAAAQKKAEAGSTFGSQMSLSNALHDLGQAGVGAWDTLKGFAKTAVKDPLLIGTGSQQQLTPERIKELENSSFSDVMHQSGQRLRELGGTLRTKAQGAVNAVTSPGQAVDTAAANLPTPDRAAQLVGSGTTMAALPLVLPNAGRAVSSTGNVVTAVGEGIPATAAGGIGGAIGGVVGRGVGGASIGASIGAAVPSAIRGTGRLITATGNLMQGPKLAAELAAAPSVLDQAMGSAVDSGQLRQMPEDMTGVTRNMWGYTRSPEGQRIMNEAAAAREARRAAIVKNLTENPPPPTPPKPPPTPPSPLIPGAAMTNSSAVPQEPAPIPGAAATGSSAVPPPGAMPVSWEQFTTQPGSPEPPPVEGAGGETVTTPSPAELTADEVRRKEIGARDFAAEQRRESGGDISETPEEVRARTRARTTGKTDQVSVLPTLPVNRIVGRLKDMIASGATDAELLDYVNKAPGDTAKKNIGLIVNTLLHGTGRNVVGLGGAALTGAALRQALVSQLQGDDKQEQD